MQIFAKYSLTGTKSAADFPRRFSDTFKLLAVAYNALDLDAKPHRQLRNFHAGAADYVTSEEPIKELLGKQVYSSVRWQQSVEKMTFMQKYATLCVNALIGSFRF